MTALRIATRGSQLALWQAEMVRDRLRLLAPDREIELVIVKTSGDLRQDVPLSAVAGKGVFVREIESTLLLGDADLAVHSCKDLPSVETPGTTLAAFCPRHDPRDALISRHGGWNDLPDGATVATSAPRRIAQLKHARPDLQFVAIRGNVDTRLAKLDRGDADALVLAVAGLERLGLGDRITERLPIALSLPQVGQGCVAVQCREDDTETVAMVRQACDDPITRQSVTTERAFLARLGGGCTAPVAAHALREGERLYLTARVASPDGATMLEARQSVSAQEPGGETALATAVFNELLEKGAKSLLVAGDEDEE
ncbi:MAG: hydroxymethylbilane synthase [Armatimonadaceae bacterium]